MSAPAWLPSARRDVGLREIPGAQTAPRIVGGGVCAGRVHALGRAGVNRAQFLAQFAAARREVAELRKLYPHAMRWAVARLP